MGTSRELGPEELRRACDSEALGVSGSQEVAPPTAPLGQPRAVAALELGTAMTAPGFNIFVAGAPGTGRSVMARMMVEAAAARRSPPPEWAYVHNFADPRRPRALRLPAGRGGELRRDVDHLITQLDHALSSAFESEDYQQRRDEVLRQYHEQRHQALAQLEQQAQEAGLALVRGPAGLLVAPAREGEVLSPQEYAALPEEERQALDGKREELQERLVEILRQGHRLEKEAREAVRQLDREMVEFAVAPLIEELIDKHADLPQVVEHCKAMLSDLLDNVPHFRDGEERALPLPFPPGLLPEARSPYERYQVNLLVERGSGDGAPVVYEPNPTLHSLTGEVEYQTQMGALVTDFGMVRPGALHRANGGYLLLDALAVLRRPFAWDALTRALNNHEIRIESLGDQYRLVSTVTLEPEPIPLDVKVVLIGTPLLYYLLYQHEEDFRKLFAVKADLGSDIDRTPDNEAMYVGFVARVCQEQELPPFSAGALARLIEEGSRLAEQQDKLTMRLLEVAELIQEAAFWARQRDPEAAQVEAEDLAHALEQRRWRSNRIEERMLEQIEQGVLMVDTEGQAVGQVNGIALLPLGDYTVGKPTRITARAYLGRAGVVNIEREVQLAGPIHNKGVLILGGYLGEKYATDRPLSCSVSLGFEQSYDEIEGDSASAAELFTLLSALGQMPLRQDLAVTGSVNQHGLIQPVGGVTRKVEGFFEACRVRGLTGTQGVILPASNQRHLMLSPEVVEAVRAGQFHVYAIRTLDEGLELLTGLPAGEPDAAGAYPEDSGHGRVQRRLNQFAEALRRFAAPEAEEKRSEEPAETGAPPASPPPPHLRCGPPPATEGKQKEAEEPLWPSR